MCIPLTWRYLLAFYCLGALMGMSHELAHHAAGFAICGDWGYKTFNSFVLAEGCKQAHPEGYWLATLVGPVLFNYLPLWIGVALVQQADAGKQLFGGSLTPVPNAHDGHDQPYVHGFVHNPVVALPDAVPIVTAELPGSDRPKRVSRVL